MGITMCRPRGFTEILIGNLVICVISSEFSISPVQ